MTDNIFDGLRGYIEYPCGCKAKILVYSHLKQKMRTP